MPNDFFSDAVPTVFHWDTPVKVYNFYRSDNNEMVPVTPIPKQSTTQDQTFHAEILVADDRSLIDIYEALEYLGPMYNFAPLEWNTTVSSSIKEDTLTICVIQIGEHTAF